MNTKLNLIIAIVLVIIALLLITYFKFKKESFADYTMKCETIPVNNYITTSKSKDLISSGIVNKYLFEGKYHYHYEFNLPLVTGNYYNKTTGKYVVMLGNTKDDNLIIGELTRSGDGIYKFKLVSDINYKFTKVAYKLDSTNEIDILFTKEF